MRTQKTENFEKELPSGYKQALYINAKDAKFGIIFNLIGFVIMAIVMAIAFLPLITSGRLTQGIFEIDPLRMMISDVVLIASLLVYIVLHELVHGAAYKALTGEKLTFGMSWSCAFCGVPNIFTYRKTALIAVVAPFAVFSVILIAATAVLYFVSPLYYLMAALVFGIHLGGCSGDLWVLYLLTVKFRKKTVLMRDTGPEQFFYVYEGN